MFILIIKLRTLLSRKTSSDFFLPEIDGFRFFAIFSVILYHLNTHVSRTFSKSVDNSDIISTQLYTILSKGSVGVDVFFAISGFILALPFARNHLFGTKRVNIKSYYIRRITRLEPPYVISLILFLVVHIIILHANFNEIFPHFLSSLFYTHSIVYNQWSTINPVAWSLEVEVQFYLLAPLMATLFAIPNNITRRLVMGAIVIVSILHYNLNYQWIEHWHLRKSLFMHMHQFIIGFIMADLFLVTWKGKPQIHTYIWDILGIAAMTSLLVWNEPFSILDDLLFSVALLISFSSIFKGKLVGWFYTRSVIVVTGGMCYSIYLLHYALIAFLTERTKIFLSTESGYGINFFIQFVLIIPVVLLISAIYFTLIERPCMDKDWPAKLKAKMLSIF